MNDLSSALENRKNSVAFHVPILILHHCLEQGVEKISKTAFGSVVMEGSKLLFLDRGGQAVFENHRYPVLLGGQVMSPSSGLLVECTA